MLIQVMLLFVLALALVLTWRRFRQQAVHTFEAIGWSIVWIAVAVVVAYPETATVLARFVGVGRGADLMLYASVVVLLILVFQLHVAHRRLEHSLTDLVRRQALEEWEKSDP